jgi:hypothetical protein
MNTALQKVADYHGKYGIKFSHTEEPESIQTWMTGEHAQFRMVIAMTMDDGGLICLANFPLMVPEEARPAMALQLVKLNFESAWGSFEMDPTDGEVRFRTVIPIIDGALADEHLDYLIRLNSIILDRHTPELVKLCNATGLGIASEENAVIDGASRYQRN